MVNLIVRHTINDLQLMINLCSKLIKNSTGFIDVTDYYNVQSYCKKLRTKKETNFTRMRLKPRKTVNVSMNINELKSLEILFDLNYVVFIEDQNIKERLLFSSILEHYNLFKKNHIYDPF